MKHIEKWKKWRILIYIGVLGTLLACTEQMLHDGDTPTDELTVSVAREWYDSQYAPIVMTRTCEEDGKELPVKPDWKGAKTSSWGRFETVETPILTNGVHLILDSETALHWDPCTKVDYICNTTRMVVLKDKITGKIRSFVMIFVGSYDYLKNTRNMTKNSYLYREPDYDGLVLFYAINGSFINGWRYSDGKIVGYLSPSCNTQAESFVSTRGVQQVCHDICTTEYSYNCHDEYVLVGGDMETGLIYDTVTYCDLVPYERCYRECEFVDDGKVDPNNPYPPGGAGNPEPENPDDNHHQGSVTPNVDKLYGSGSTLSKLEKQELETAVSEVKKSPIFKKLLDDLALKTKIDFKIKPDINSGARFETDNSISFKSDVAIGAGALREELVHALQYNLFYREDMEKPANKFNIELEAHIFVDAALTLLNNNFLKSGSNTIGYSGSESLKGAMEILMNSILNKGGFSNEQLPLYREVANNWYQYSGTYTESFPPKTLYQYIKK